MRLTQWTDYTLRVLMYCAATEGRERPVTITEVAEGYGISRSHLMKIVQQLSAQGVLETTRGRGGGMRLMRPASSINIGAIVRATETDFNLVECFDPATDRCRLSGQCRLKGVLGRAIGAYLAVLDGTTLADLVDAPLPGHIPAEHGLRPRVFDGPLIAAGSLRPHPSSLPPSKAGAE